MDFGGHATTNVVAWNMGDLSLLPLTPEVLDSSLINAFAFISY